MRRMRNSILSLLIYVIVLFNIERLDVGEKQNVVNLETAFYVLTMLAVLAILFVKQLSKLQRSVLLGVWITTYFVVKFILTTQHPLFGGIYTYLTITELCLFVLAVLLAHNVALQIEDFEQAVENFTFADIHKVKQIQEANTEIQDEIYRSRRFHRPLSIVILEHAVKKDLVHYNKLVQDAQRAVVERYASVMLSRELIAQLRRTDILLGTEKRSRLVIFSPDTGVNEAETLVNRLRALADTEDISVNFGAATFPDHALTFDDLMNRAEENLSHKPDRKKTAVKVETHEKVGVS